MCGRFDLIASGEQIAIEFDLDAPPPVVARYNIAPTQPVLAIRNDRGFRREAVHLHWGLIPSWSKDAKFGARMINARSETVADKPSFRAAFKRRRCIVPVTGFYEWQKLADKKKQPTHIESADSSLLALAGLWEYWESPDGAVESCTILTTTPNTVMAPIHDRMPVILNSADYHLWLDNAAPLHYVHALLKPAPDPLLTTYPVSTFVNSPRNEGPQCRQPLA